MDTTDKKFQNKAEKIYQKICQREIADKLYLVEKDLGKIIESLKFGISEKEIIENSLNTGMTGEEFVENVLYSEDIEQEILERNLMQKKAEKLSKKIYKEALKRGCEINLKPNEVVEAIRLGIPEEDVIRQFLVST